MFRYFLLYRLKKGNREAFNGVFRYYYPDIQACCFSVVEQKQREDIVQDVFIAYLGKKPKSYMSVMVSILIFFNPLILVVWTISRKTSRLKNTILYLREVLKINAPLKGVMILAEELSR